MEEINKECTACKEIKSLSGFRKSKMSKDGYTHECKTCLNERTAIYRKTKIGVCTCIYNDQCSSSKKRNHNKPTYNRLWLYEWLIHQPNFELLYNNWVNSGYYLQLKPSVDRINDNIGYIKDNIQLMTWAQNREKYYKMIRSGESVHFPNPHKAVIQLTLDGEFVKEFVSASQAQRETNIYATNISTICSPKNNRKTTGGYIWKFK